MPTQMTTIEIDIDVYRAIEAQRTSFSQSANAILREALVCPQTPPADIPTASTPPTLPPTSVLRTRRTGTFSFTLFGERFDGSSLKQAYLTCLTRLASRNSSFLASLSEVQTRTRRIVAKRAEDLYLRTPGLADKHAFQLTDGWWVDTNLSRSQCEQRVKIASQVAGITFGRDLTLDFPA